MDLIVLAIKNKDFYGLPMRCVDVDMAFAL